jgi:hypothetical protein
MTILYGILFPKTYLFKCEEEPDRVTWKQKTEYLEVRKYFFDMKSTLNNYKFWECRGDGSKSIGCKTEWIINDTLYFQSSSFNVRESRLYDYINSSETVNGQKQLKSQRYFWGECERQKNIFED